MAVHVVASAAAEGRLVRRREEFCVTGHALRPGMKLRGTNSVVSNVWLMCDTVPASVALMRDVSSVGKGDSFGSADGSSSPEDGVFPGLHAMARPVAGGDPGGMEAKLARLQEELSLAEQLKGVLQEQVRSAFEQVDAANKRAQEAEQEAAKAKEDAAKAAHKASKHHAQAEGVSQQLSAALGDAQVLRQQLGEYEDELGRCREALLGAQTRLASYELAADTREAHLKERLAEADAAAAAANDRASVAEAAAADAHAALAAEHARLLRKSVEDARLARELAFMTDTVAQRDRQLAARDRMLDALRRERAEWSAEKSLTAKQAEGQLRLLQLENDALRGERDKLRARLDGLPSVSALFTVGGRSSMTSVKVMPLTGYTGAATAPGRYDATPLAAGGAAGDGIVHMDEVRGELRFAADAAARVIAAMREREHSMTSALERAAAASGRAPRAAA